MADDKRWFLQRVDADRLEICTLFDAIKNYKTETKSLTLTGTISAGGSLDLEIRFDARRLETSIAQVKVNFNGSPNDSSKWRVVGNHPRPGDVTLSGYGDRPVNTFLEYQDDQVIVKFNIVNDDISSHSISPVVTVTATLALSVPSYL